MTTLQSLFFATALFASGTPSAAPVTGEAYSEMAVTVSDEAADERAPFETLSGTLNTLIDYPEFSDSYVEPIQEMIVNVRFTVDDENRIEVTDVRGTDRQFNNYVKRSLDGQSIGSSDVAQNVTFQTTLRFVR